MDATLVLVVVVLASAPALAGLIVQFVRWRRTPVDLRGNWWPRFEQAFRTYVAQQAPPEPRPPRRDARTGLRHEET